MLKRVKAFFRLRRLQRRKLARVYAFAGRTGVYRATRLSKPPRFPLTATQTEE